ncbi:MAG: hypothetical protein R3250_10635, partial [Melioribacteraceae bacterium]|nr:hypothetical protein [Melioribacteraceae bacterium]
TVYHSNGEVKTETYYKQGKKDGVESTYYSSGEIESFGIYINGKKDGKYYRYHLNGLIETEAEYDSGQLIAITKYDENGLKQEKGS